jgi:sulfatase maturation enzyme AslB (radical SAM superfamily)
MIGGKLQQLRWRWFLASKSANFATDYLDLTYRIYLNHDKVIHYRDGYAVRSLSTPAVLSKPAANFMARTLYRTIQNRNLPNMMSFAINDVCNVNCEHCSFFEGVDEKGRPVLTLSQAQKVIRDAADLGVSILNFVGGEPLLRKDLPELIRAVDKNLTTTVLFTNGTLLAEKAAVLRHAGLDSVYVSLDAADPDKHDRFRRSKGLFDKAVRGIREAKSVGLSVGLSCTLTPESFASGELVRLIELGKRSSRYPCTWLLSSVLFGTGKALPPGSMLPGSSSSSHSGAPRN